MMRKQYDELRTKISETEVERYTRLVDVERKQVSVSRQSGLE